MFNEKGLDSEHNYLKEIKPPEHPVDANEIVLENDRAGAVKVLIELRDKYDIEQGKSKDPHRNAVVDLKLILINSLTNNHKILRSTAVDAASQLGLDDTGFTEAWNEIHAVVHTHTKS